MPCVNIFLQRYFLMQDIIHAIQMTDGIEILTKLEERCRCLHFGRWENVEPESPERNQAIDFVVDKF